MCIKNLKPTFDNGDTILQIQIIPLLILVVIQIL